MYTETFVFCVLRGKELLSIWSDPKKAKKEAAGKGAHVSKRRVRQ